MQKQPAEPLDPVETDGLQFGCVINSDGFATPISWHEIEARAMALWPPKIFNIRSDSFERAEIEAGGYVRWFVDHMFVLLPAQQIVGRASRHLPGLPAAQAAGQLLHRQGDGNADGDEPQLIMVN